MISRVAIVPGTPMLIPDIAAGAAVELADVRAAALDRLAWAAMGSERITVIAPDPASRTVTRCELPERVSLRPLGIEVTVCLEHGASCDLSRHPSVEGGHCEGRHLPVSALVSAWLASTRGIRVDAFWSVPIDPAGLVRPVELDGADGLLVIADGSSTRTAKAPGSFVQGAVDFDDRLVAAIASVDTGFFADPQRSADATLFGAQGLGALALAATSVEATPWQWSGTVDVTADPYGVAYVVAGWSSLP